MAVHLRGRCFARGMIVRLVIYGFRSGGSKTTGLAIVSDAVSDSLWLGVIGLAVSELACGTFSSLGYKRSVAGRHDVLEMIWPDSQADRVSILQ